VAQPTVTASRAGARGAVYPELTWHGVITGWVLGVIIAASIGYAALKLGFSIEGSELAAILGFAILRGLLGQHPLRRAGVAGGDTSGYIARELGITSLEAVAPVAPGSPLCRVQADNPLDGMELIFKGGQVGKDDVWLTLLHGNDHSVTV